MKLSDLAAPNQLFAYVAKGIEGSKVIIINILVARAFGPEDFGRFSYIIAVIAVMAVVAEFRLQSVLVKELSQTSSKEKQQTLVSSAMLGNLFFAIVGVVSAFFFHLYEEDQTIAVGILIYSMTFLFKVPRAFRSFFIAEERVILVAKCEIITFFLLMALIYIALASADNVIVLVLVKALDFLILSALFLIFYILEEKRKLLVVPNLKISKMLVVGSYPLVLSGAAMLLFQKIDLILINQILNPKAVGIYSSALSVMMLFSLLPMVVSESLAPKMFKSSGLETADTRHQKFSNLVILSGTFMSVLMAVSSPFLVPLLFGDEYTGAIASTLILSLCPLLISMGASSAQIIVAKNQQKHTSIKSIAACVLAVMLNLLLIPSYGIEGAAIATVFSFFFANFGAHLFMSVYRNIFKIQCASIVSIFKLSV